MSLCTNGATDQAAKDQIFLRRKQWFQSVRWSIQNQKVRIDSNPFLSATFFMGKNVTYEIWIEIQAKVYNNRTVNEEIVDLNLKRANASDVFKDIREFHYQKISNVMDDVNDLLNRYEKGLRLYPTLKAMETGHAEVRSEIFSQNLTALIEYQKIWDDSQQARCKIAYLKKIGPPFYSPEGTAEENSCFFSRFATDEGLQSIFRTQENALWHTILPRMKAFLERNKLIFEAMGLPIDIFEIESYVRFLYQFQTRATICFTMHIESVWMEERTEIVDIILHEVLRKLEFIMENGLLLRNDLCVQSELPSHFEGIDTLIDRFERLLIRRIRFSQNVSILNLPQFLDKSWSVISRISMQVSISNTIRYRHTFCDVENAFIEKIRKEINNLKDIDVAFFRKLELLKEPLSHVLEFYRKLDLQIVKFRQYSGNLILERDLLAFLKSEKYSLISFYDSKTKDDVSVFASHNLSTNHKYLDLILESVCYNSFLVELIPANCYILLVSHVDISYWDGDIIEVEIKSVKISLTASTFSIFPWYTFDRRFVDGFFIENIYDTTTWFLSTKIETFFSKIRNNIHLLAYKLVEISKSISISTRSCRNEIFQLSFNFVSELPEFLRQESLMEGIIDGMIDTCSKWIYFSLKELETKRQSMRRLVDILGNITDTISIGFDVDRINHVQFEKLRCAIAAALKELVQRQMFSHLNPLDKFRQGGIPADIYRLRGCFQPGRESRLLNSINDLDSKLDLIHGYGIVIDSKENSFEKSFRKIATTLPVVDFKWRKGKFLHRSTLSKVYLGRMMDKNIIIAVKEYDIRDVTYLRRIIAYGRNVIKLDHPNICKHYGMAIERANIYILMEFCGGGTLERILESGPIGDVATIKEFAKEILEGLNYLHSLGMIHRDIKPSNILFGAENMIKISGFNCVRMENDIPYFGEDKSFGLVGTARYIPPEMIRGEDSNSPSAQDIWALGMIICQMATGKIPYCQYDDDWAVYYHIGKGELPELPTSKEVSECGLDFLHHTLEPIPNKRPISSQLLQHAWFGGVE